MVQEGWKDWEMKQNAFPDLDVSLLQIMKERMTEREGKIEREKRDTDIDRIYTERYKYK